MKKIFREILLTVVCLLSACTVSETEQNRIVNIFAKDLFESYYLWKDEVKDSLALWNFNDTPQNNIDRCRYRNPDGSIIDQHSSLLSDVDAYSLYPSGMLTFGFDFCHLEDGRDSTYKECVVTKVYPGGPADQAGIRRGDRFQIPDELQYVERHGRLAYDKDSCTFRMENRNVKLFAVPEPEDPLIIQKIFNISGRKVGYMFFDSFDYSKAGNYYDAFKTFKESGVDDMILDLRYNLGGHADLADMIASILAPEEYVDYMYPFIYRGEEKIQLRVLFWPEDRDGKEMEYNVDYLNLGIKNLYLIYTGNSASASEYLCVGLRPYMNVTVIGDKSYGKFVGGPEFPMSDFLEARKDSLSRKVYRQGKRISDGKFLYLMTFKYTDCNKENPYISTGGIIPDYKVYDKPYERYQLGDEQESMLSATLDIIKGKEISIPDSEEKILAKRPDGLYNFEMVGWK